MSDKCLACPPIVQSVQVVSFSGYLSPDILTARIRQAGVITDLPDDESSAQDQCVMEQVVMLSPATLDLTVGNLPFGPTLVDRQVAETELAQLLFLHLL
jgi:hypothetical protein